MKKSKKKVNKASSGDSLFKLVVVTLIMSGIACIIVASCLYYKESYRASYDMSGPVSIKSANRFNDFLKTHPKKSIINMHEVSGC